MGIFEAIGLGGLIGKLAAIGGGVVALLFAWWLKGKAGERKGLQKADDAAREREREAYEDVARLRGSPGPGALGGGVRDQIRKPIRESPDSAKDRRP